MTTDAEELFLCMTNEGQLYSRLFELARSDAQADRTALSFMVARYACSYNRRFPECRLALGPNLTTATVEALRDYYRSE